MLLQLDRNPTGIQCTEGKFWIPQSSLSSDTKFNCVTLEPIDRGLTDKMDAAEIQVIKSQWPKGETAMPTGTWPVQWLWSNDWQKYVPHVICTGFDATEIHPGNWAKNTKGCICVGKTIISPTMIGESDITCQALYGVIKGAVDRHEPIFIAITRPATS